jgi:L-fuculose-phosphate aldolase
MPRAPRARAKVEETEEAPAPLAPAPSAPSTSTLESMQTFGRDMYLTGLVSSHTGSLSAREGDQVIITRRNAMLGHLTAEDLLVFPIEDELPAEAPEDAAVHLAVYRTSDAQAVIYARPPATMALALVDDRLSPAVADGADQFGSAPVLIAQRSLGSPDLAQLISRILRENRVVALRGQGVFAHGSSVPDALHMLTLLEEMCKVGHLYRALGSEEGQQARRAGPMIQDRQPNGYGPRPNPTGGPRNGNNPSRPPAPRPPSQGNWRGGDGQNRRPGGGTPRDPNYRGQSR